jgi:simple sugar transport system permease protein
MRGPDVSNLAADGGIADRAGPPTSAYAISARCVASCRVRSSARSRGAVLVLIVFLLAAGDSGMFSAEGIVNWATVAAFLGIISVGAALLMIGGEFDLSIGSMIGFAGMISRDPCVCTGAGRCGVACAFTFALCAALGAVNGYLVIRTGLPSFIVTLAFTSFCAA